MKTTLKKLESIIATEKSVRLTIPSEWLESNKYTDKPVEGMLSVEVTYMERPTMFGKNVWFMCRTYGRSILLPDSTEVEIKDVSLLAQPKIGYGKGQTVRGISIE